MHFNHDRRELVVARPAGCAFLGIVCLLALALPAGGQLPRCRQGDLLATKIKKFDAQDLSPIEVLLRVGRQHDICFAVEYVTKKTLLPSQLHELGDGTLGDVLAVLFPPSDGYVFVDRAGLVEIQNNRLPRTPDQNLLKLKIPVFKTIRRASVQDNSNALRIQLFYTLHPEATGVAGSYPTGDSANEAGPFDERDKTVEELLDLVVSRSSKGGLWLARVPFQRLGSLPPSGIWAVLDYGAEPSSYRPLLRAFAADLAE